MRYLLAILFCFSAFAQRTPRVVDSTAALVALTPSASVPDVVVVNTNNNTRLQFRYYPSASDSTNAASPYVFATSTGTGRWKEVRLTGDMTGVTVDGASIDATAKLDITNGAAVNLQLNGLTIYGGNGSNDLTGNTLFNLGLRGINGETVSVYPTAHTVDSVATMQGLNTGLVTTNATVQVRGRNTPNDGGGGTFYFEPFVATNAGTAFAAGSASFQWSRIWDGTTVEAAWFGAFAGDGVADSDAINAAMDYVHSLGRGNVRLGGGRYDIDKTLRVPYKVNLIGTPGWKINEEASSIATNSLYLVGGPTQLRLTDSANVDMLWLDSTDGYIRQAGEVLEDGETVDARIQDSLIENIIFFGNAANQTLQNCRGLVAKAKWNIRVQNCGFIFHKGYGIYIFDVNGLIMDNITSIQGDTSVQAGKGCMFMYSSADCYLRNFYFGLSRGPVVWFNSESQFKNICSDMMLWNAYRTNSIWPVSSWTTNTLATFAQELPFESGDPLEFRTTGTLPTPFTDLQLYFAVRIATNVFGFHTNYALATNGVYLAGSGSASGTNWVTVGPATGLYFSGQSSANVFTGLRVDQNSGPGVVFRNAFGNAIVGLEAGENGGPANAAKDEVTPDGEKVAVLFDQDAFTNSVSGTVYDQNIGWLVRSNAAGNVVSAVMNEVLTNSVANSTGQNYEPLLKNLGSVASWGTGSIGTALDLTGNASGDRIIKLSRTSGITQQIGLGVGQDALNVWNETDGRAIALIGNDGTAASYQFGDATSATPIPAAIYATAGSGANVAGAPLRIYADRSTGNADTTDAVIIYTGDAGASSSTLQTDTAKVVVRGDGSLAVATDVEFGLSGDTVLARSAAGKLTLNTVPVVLAPSVGTLSYSGGDVTVTAGKGPLQEDTLTAAGNFNLLFTSLATRDAGTILVWPAATNCTVTLPSYAYGPSGTTLTIEGGTGYTNHTEIAWKNLVVGGTNRVSVNALNYYR